MAHKVTSAASLEKNGGVNIIRAAIHVGGNDGFNLIHADQESAGSQ